MKTRRIIAVTAAVLSAAISMGSISAFAAAPPKEDIIETIWEDFYSGDEDDGTTFPQGSWLYNVVTTWVDENYDAEGGSSKMDRWIYLFNQDYKKMIEDYYFRDDGKNWTIETEDGTVYSFELIDGQWNQFDNNGNLIDIFPPHSTLGERDEQQYIPETQPVTEAPDDNSHEAADTTRNPNADYNISSDGSTPIFKPSATDEIRAAGEMQTAGEKTEPETIPAGEIAADTAVSAEKMDTADTTTTKPQQTEKNEESSGIPVPLCIAGGIGIAAVGIGATYAVMKKKK